MQHVYSVVQSKKLSIKLYKVQKYYWLESNFFSNDRSSPKKTTKKCNLNFSKASVHITCPGFWVFVQENHSLVLELMKYKKCFSEDMWSCVFFRSVFFVEHHPMKIDLYNKNNKLSETNSTQFELCALNLINYWNLPVVCAEESQIAFSDSMNMVLTSPSVIWVAESLRPRRGKMASICKLE